MSALGNLRKPLAYNGSNIIANIQIAGEMVSATIDTSSFKNFINKGLFKKITAQLTNSLLTEAVQLDVHFGNKSSQFEFFLKQDPIEGVVLGLDFLSQIGTTFICGGETLELKRAPPVDDQPINININQEENNFADRSEFPQPNSVAAEPSISFVAVSCAPLQTIVPKNELPESLDFDPLAGVPTTITTLTSPKPSPEQPVKLRCVNIAAPSQLQSTPKPIEPIPISTIRCVNLASLIKLEAMASTANPQTEYASSAQSMSERELSAPSLTNARLRRVYYRNFNVAAKAKLLATVKKLKIKREPDTEANKIVTIDGKKYQVILLKNGKTIFNAFDVISEATMPPPASLPTPLPILSTSSPIITSSSQPPLNTSSSSSKIKRLIAEGSMMADDSLIGLNISAYGNIIVQELRCFLTEIKSRYEPNKERFFVRTISDRKFFLRINKNGHFRFFVVENEELAKNMTAPELPPPKPEQSHSAPLPATLPTSLPILPISASKPQAFPKTSQSSSKVKTLIAEGTLKADDPLAGLDTIAYGNINVHKLQCFLTEIKSQWVPNKQWSVVRCISDRAIWVTITRDGYFRIFVIENDKLAKNMTATELPAPKPGQSHPAPPPATLPTSLPIITSNSSSYSNNRNLIAEGLLTADDPLAGLDASAYDKVDVNELRCFLSEIENICVKKRCSLTRLISDLTVSIKTTRAGYFRMYLFENDALSENMISDTTTEMTFSKPKQPHSVTPPSPSPPASLLTSSPILSPTSPTNAQVSSIAKILMAQGDLTDNDPFASLDISAYDNVDVQELYYFFTEMKNRWVPRKKMTSKRLIGSQNVWITVAKSGYYRLYLLKNNLANNVSMTNESPPTCQTWRPSCVPPTTPFNTSQQTIPITQYSNFVPATNVPFPLTTELLHQMEFTSAVPPTTLLNTPQQTTRLSLSEQEQPAKSDPLAGVDVSEYDAATVVELRKIIWNSRFSCLKDGIVQKIRGHLIRIKLLESGLISLETVRGLAKECAESTSKLKSGQISQTVSSSSHLKGIKRSQSLTEEDPLTGVDVSGYDDETIKELRNVVRKIKHAWSCGQSTNRMLEVKGQQIQIRVDSAGSLTLRKLASLNETEAETLYKRRRDYIPSPPPPPCWTNHGSNYYK